MPGYNTPAAVVEGTVYPHMYSHNHTLIYQRFSYMPITVPVNTKLCFSKTQSSVILFM